MLEIYKKTGRLPTQDNIRDYVLARADPNHLDKLMEKLQENK